MSQESRYLDAIEDAQDQYDRFRSGMRWTTFALTTSIAAVLVGSAFPLGGLTIALNVMGACGMLLSIVFGGVWLTAHMDGEHPQKTLKNAQRTHARFIMEQADG